MFGAKIIPSAPGPHNLMKNRLRTKMKINLILDPTSSRLGMEYLNAENDELKTEYWRNDTKNLEIKGSKPVSRNSPHLLTPKKSQK